MTAVIQEITMLFQVPFQVKTPAIETKSTVLQVLAIQSTFANPMQRQKPHRYLLANHFKEVYLKNLNQKL